MKQILRMRIWAVISSPLVCLLFLWNSIPAQVPLHFNLLGKPDRFGDRSEFLLGVITLVIVNICVFLLVGNAYRLNPSKTQAANKGTMQKFGFGMSIFLTAITFFVIYSTIHAVNGNYVKTNFIFSALGLLYCMIGDYMFSIKPNGVVGIRIPATLKDPENWRLTHRVAGKLWFWGGLLTALICIFLPPSVAVVIFFIATLILVAIPITYSASQPQQK